MMVICLCTWQRLSLFDFLILWDECKVNLGGREQAQNDCHSTMSMRLVSSGGSLSVQLQRGGTTSRSPMGHLSISILKDHEMVCSKEVFCAGSNEADLESLVSDIHVPLSRTFLLPLTPVGERESHWTGLMFQNTSENIYFLLLGRKLFP